MCKLPRLSRILFGLLAGLSFNCFAEPDPNFHIYLMFGQSNMEGVGTIEAQDRVVNDRVKVMSDLNCGNLGRTYGKWYVAVPPLNRCWSGIGIGDYFGKTMADGVPSNITIGLVPGSVSGTPIELFQKSAPLGRNDADIPTQFSGGYAWLLDMAKKAKEVGVIKGIIFHQGETNTADPQWKFKVQEIVQDLRKDLDIGEVPFLAGELLYSDYGSCCHWHNQEINKLPDLIPNSVVISASGLPGADTAHFTTASYREYGKRYATVMLTKVSAYESSSSKASSSASSVASSKASSVESSTASSAAAVSPAASGSSSGGGGSLGLLDLWLLALIALGFGRFARR